MAAIAKAAERRRCEGCRWFSPNQRQLMKGANLGICTVPVPALPEWLMNALPKFTKNRNNVNSTSGQTCTLWTPPGEPGILACGHRSYAHTNRCPEMACFNYIGKHVNDVRPEIEGI